MAVFEVSTPDGRKFEVTTPDGATEADAIAYARTLPPPPERPGFLGSLIKGGIAGIQQFGGDVFGGIPAAIGSAVDSEDTAQSGIARLKRAKEQQAATLPNPYSFEELEQTYNDQGLMAALGKVPGWAGQNIGQSGTYMLPGIAAGAAAGSLLGPLGTIGGGIAGGMAARIPTFLGSNIGRQVEEGATTGAELRPGAALAAAVPQAAAETVELMMFGVGKLTGAFGRAAVTDMAKRVVAGAAKGGLKAVAAEIPVEIGQAVLERWQAGLPLDNDDAIREYKENAAGVLPLAGTVGTYTGGAGARRQNRMNAHFDQAYGQVEKDAALRDAATAAAKEESDRAGIASLLQQNQEAPLQLTYQPQETAETSLEEFGASLGRTVTPTDFDAMAERQAGQAQDVEAFNLSAAGRAQMEQEAALADEEERRGIASLPAAPVRADDVIQEINSRRQQIGQPPLDQVTAEDLRPYMPEPMVQAVMSRQQPPVEAPMPGARRSRAKPPVELPPAVYGPSSLQPVIPGMPATPLPAPAQTPSQTAPEGATAPPAQTAAPGAPPVQAPPAAPPDYQAGRNEPTPGLVIRGDRTKIDAANVNPETLPPGQRYYTTDEAVVRDPKTGEPEALMEPVLDKAGQPRRHPNGQPIMKRAREQKRDAKGQPVVTDKGYPVMVPAVRRGWAVTQRVAGSPAFAPVATYPTREAAEAHTERLMPGPPVPTPAQRADSARVEQAIKTEAELKAKVAPHYHALRKLADVMGPAGKRLGLKFVGTLTDADGNLRSDAEGSYQHSLGLITLAMDAVPSTATTEAEITEYLAGVLTHEVVHVLEKTEQLRKPDVKIMLREALKMPHPDGKPGETVAQYVARANPTLRGDQLKSEMIAEVGRRWAKGDPAHPQVRSIMRGIVDFFRRLANLMRGQGFQTIEDVVQAIRSGEVGQRTPKTTSKGAADGAADAEVFSATTPEAGRVPGPGEFRGSPGRLEAAYRAHPGDSLQGAPGAVTVPGLGKVQFRAWGPAQDLARAYAAEAGIDYRPPQAYAKVDPERAARIAAEYERMPDAPGDPTVRAAYDAMIKETEAQFRHILRTGLDIEFIDYAAIGDPYKASPRLAIMDVITNNHFFVFSTLDGFGNEPMTPEKIAANPLLAMTPYRFHGKPVLANDLFRVVHDYFGHVKDGNGFRADGEENAWRAHSAMYSPLAARAMTSETRGQNSWVNYGPHGAHNRTASGEDTIFAEQKVGLLPAWVSSGVASPDEQFSRRPQEIKGSAEGETEDAIWRRLQPERTAEGRIKGAPEWVRNTRDLTRLRQLIHQLVGEGVDGRFWYENSAAKILQLTNGDVAKAEKVIGLLAIYSPQTPVFTNWNFATKAYEQWLRGEPIKVKTAIQDEKAQAWLEHGRDWGGRKTNSFYINLMHEIVANASPADMAKMQIPAEVLANVNKATVDLWVLRALGYKIDAAKGVGEFSKYGFSERELQRVAGELNGRLAEGEQRWVPHQVQAALWSAIKARHEIDAVKEKTWAESLRKGYSRWVPDKKKPDQMVRAAPSENTPERQQHMKIWRKHALRATPEDTAEQMRDAKGSFGDAIDRVAQNVTWEAVPTSAIGHKINTASQSARTALTKAAVRLITDEQGNDLLAQQLGVNLSTNAPRVGAYAGDVNPNVVTKLVPNKPKGFFDSTSANAYARAIQYIFKQDAVPYFRADAQADFEGDYRVIAPAGNTLRRFDTQTEAEAYAKQRPGAKVVGGKFARGVNLVFSQDLDDAAHRAILAALQKQLGPDVGYTKTGDREIAVINYRGENGIPFLNDEKFLDGIERLQRDDGRELGLGRYEKFGSEGDYGPVHDWKAEPLGPSPEAAGGSPAVQRWIRGRAAAFEQLLADWRGGRAKPGRAARPGSSAEAVSDEQFSTRASPEAEVSTDTEEGRAWFAGSAVTNPDGSPRRVYTGTSKDSIFRKFKIPRNGAWFTADPEEASQYAVENDSMGARYEVGGGRPPRWEKVNSASRVIPAYLQIRNPLKVDTLPDELRYADNYRRAQNTFFDRLRAQGHDGMIIGDQIFVVLKSPTQIKSPYNPMKPGAATNEQFSRRPTPAVAVPADIDAIMKRTTFQPDTRDLKQRVVDKWMGKGALLRRLYQELVYNYAPIQRAEAGQNLTADVAANAKLLAAERSNQIAARAMMIGAPQLLKIDPNNPDSNYVMAVASVNNIKAAMKPMIEGGLLQVFQAYAQARRGFRLSGEGKETPMSPAEISRVKQWVETTHPSVKDSFEMYQRANNELMDFVHASGVISAAEKQRYLQYQDYYGFYRQLEDATAKAPFSKRVGVGSKIVIQKLEGGDQQLMYDPVEVIMRNYSMWTGLAMRNIAAAAALKLGEQTGVATQVPKGMGNMHVRINGANQEYQVSDPDWVRALSSMEQQDIPGWMSKLGIPARILREVVTRDPSFWLRNPTRDAPAAWVTGSTGAALFKGVVKGFAGALRGGATYQQLANQGILGAHDISHSRFEDAARLVREDIQADGKIWRINSPTDLIGIIKSGWRALGHAAEASDAATRSGVFDAEMAKHGNLAEAAFRSVETLNFQRRGSSSFIQIATMLIPFLNARIQGWDVMARGAKRNPAAFLAKGATLAAIALAVQAMTEDDDEVKRAPSFAKNANILLPLKHFGFDGGLLAIPKPFELGLFFQTIPEHVSRMILKGESGHEFMRMLKSESANTLGLGSMFGLPVPQFALPALEVAANKSNFTGAPIEGAGMERLSTSERYDKNTSEIGKALGQAGVLSPKQIDHLMRGYFGAMGTYFMLATSELYRMTGASNVPPGQLMRAPMVSALVKTSDNTSTRNIADLYELKRDLDTIGADLVKLKAEGATEAIKATYEKNKQLLGTAEFVKNRAEALKQLTTQENQIIRAPTNLISLDAKRAQLEKIRDRRIEITKDVPRIMERAGRATGS